MTDLQAALGISQLNRFGAFLQRRAAIADAYQEAFRPFDLHLPVVPEGRTHVYYRYVVRPKGGSRATEELLARMERRGIHCRRPVFRPIHRCLGLEGYPASEEAGRTALSVPIYPSLTEEEVARTIQTLREELA
jgi:dTDP-4-amino-4,6-dideoxygalactose transaminase